MKEFNNAYISERYETGDIVSYDDLVIALGDGYGDPGNVQIAALDGTQWYPAGFCSAAENGVWDCDETKIFPDETYGKTWVAVCGDDWQTADFALAYLLDI